MITERLRFQADQGILTIRQTGEACDRPVSHTIRTDAGVTMRCRLQPVQ
jgi:hypothetical protein